ncbi:MAG: hypothetical protein IPH68_08910 [Chitinophagaceae bacterium]|nr:hypothetical protein [Chitinophagaceae bacterium]
MSPVTNKSIIPKVILFSFLLIGILACKATLYPHTMYPLKHRSQNHRLTDALYLQMLDVGRPAGSEKYADKYLDIQVDINSLLLKTQVRDHNTDLLVMVQNLQKMFVQFKDDHKAKTVLTDADIKLNMMQVNAVWAPLLLAEKALKRQK